MIREIRKYPDLALLTKSREWDFTRTENEVDELERDMFDTIIAANGLGLAANQIGITERFIAMRLVENDQFIMLYNPVIVSTSEDLFEESEGCLSFPGVRLDIYRSNTATVKFQNRYGDWEERTFSGWDAKCVLHECEHLDGIVIKDHVSDLKYQRAVQKAKNSKTHFTTRSQLVK